MKVNFIINCNGKWLVLNMQIRAHFIYYSSFTGKCNVAAVVVNINQN